MELLGAQSAEYTGTPLFLNVPSVSKDIVVWQLGLK